ncbi:MAG: hypothetical protein JST89_07265 [Cyanobacteria bacterium SZAS-4]|nr:hypothetical protein [Cyanobacteria bacterium SZAS-4]
MTNRNPFQLISLMVLATFFSIESAKSHPDESAANPNRLLVAVKKKAPAVRGPAKQIYELSQREEFSSCLNASGVAAYVASASGTNRGLLLRSVSSGFASSIGLQAGDVLLSVNSRVVQTGADADRILASCESGPARIVFVHPSDNGLQLYNGQFNLPKFSGAHAAPSNITFSSSGPNIVGGSASAKSKPSESMAAYESYMIELINHDRTANGSHPIQANAALSALARAHAKDMATRDFFNHVNPDGVDPQARAANAGIRGGTFENIAYQGGFESGYQQLQAAESIMMNEPKNQQNHRSNILDPDHASVGVGVMRASNGKLYVVQEFSHTSP